MAFWVSYCQNSSRQAKIPVSGKLPGNLARYSPMASRVPTSPTVQYKYFIIILLVYRYSAAGWHRLAGACGLPLGDILSTDYELIDECMDNTDLEIYLPTR